MEPGGEGHPWSNPRPEGLGDRGLAPLLTLLVTPECLRAVEELHSGGPASPKGEVGGG